MLREALVHYCANLVRFFVKIQIDTDRLSDTEHCYFVAMAQPVFMLSVVCITLYPFWYGGSSSP